MYFNSSDNKEKSICHQVDDILHTSTSSYSLDAKTRSANQWLRKVGVWSYTASGTWEYDDTNHDKQPWATTNLVTDQQLYGLPTTIDVLKIERIEYKDDDDDWNTLTVIDKDQIDIALEEFCDTSGEPQYVDLFADQIKLYPAPDYNKTNGLKLYFSRDIHAFETDDTNAEPGIPEPFQRILVMGMCYDFAIQEGWSEKARIFKGEINDLKKELQDFYGDRKSGVFERRFMPHIETYK